MAQPLDNHRPLELVFVRHGQSEGNVAVKAAERGDTSYFTPEFRKRHSSTWDLTKKGIRQAKAAGKWIRENINGGIFEGYYASTYRRAKRTAGYLNLPRARWNLRDYIREHDWGNLDVMTDEERHIKYPDAMEKRSINPYYFAAPGGESLADAPLRDGEDLGLGAVEHLVDRDVALERQQADLAAESLVGWDERLVDANDQPLPYGEEAKRDLLQITYVRAAVVQAFTTMSSGRNAARKNS